ncbi:SUKH-4 family immunity protein [Streptomyces sp. NPDC002476]|uniref:SUKH-4 family immunity protein n=1 Tax=Streptomyces sp. NPDC002476 TaxID=3364648 RepID=UPI0036BA02BF
MSNFDMTRHCVNRSDMIRMFGHALAPVLEAEQIPEAVKEAKARFTLQEIGVPTSVGDFILTDVRAMSPLREALVGIMLPAWVQSDSILGLGTFPDGFLCLDGVTGKVLLLTHELEESPVILSSNLYTFVCLLVWVGQAVYQTSQPGIRDFDAVLKEIDPGVDFGPWERAYESAR